MYRLAVKRILRLGLLGSILRTVSAWAAGGEGAEQAKEHTRPEGGDVETARHTSAWPFVLAVFAFSRLLFLGTGAVAAAMLPWAIPITPVVGPSGFLSYWAHWDGAWYSEIAKQGYDYRDSTSPAFFPQIGRAHV